MARKTFKLQVKNCFLFNIAYMYFITAGLFFISLELFFFYNFPGILPILFFISIVCVRFLIKPAKDELDMDGYNEITIDDEKKILTIDGKNNIKFDDISYVYLRFYKPDYTSATMIDSFVSLVSVNSELLIGVRNQNPIKISIQRRKSLFALLKELQKHSEIKLKFDENYNGNWALSSNLPILLLIMILLLIYAIHR